MVRQKNNYKTRYDFEEVDRRNVVHPQLCYDCNIIFFPKIFYKMTRLEKDEFLKVLKDLRVPNEYKNIFC